MICNTGNALRQLFDAAKNDLELDALEWFSGLTGNAELQAENVGSTLNALATVIADDHNSVPGNDELSNILYGLASQAGTVAALVSIGAEASFLAGRLKISGQ